MGLLSRIMHRRPDITRREKADRSGAEILAMARHYGHDLQGMIYFYNDRKVLAAPLSGRPGDALAELAKPAVEAEPVAAARIGYMALHTLLQYNPKKVSARAKRKVKEWPTLKAAGADSVKAFNEAAIGIRLKANRDCVRLEAASMLSPKRRFVVSATVPATITHADLGAVLQRLAKGAKALQQAGVL